MKKHRHHKSNRTLLIKEVIFSILAILSVSLLAYEFFGHPTTEQSLLINRFDFVVAILFLGDFIRQLYQAKQKWLFMRHNWYLLLASIPLVDGWTEALRALRILSLVRLIRAGEHVHYAEMLMVGKER